MTSESRATIEDLFRIKGKAELVGGQIVRSGFTEVRPGYAGDEIFASLRVYTRRAKSGWAVGNNKAFRVCLDHRESFSPNAAYYVGPKPTMKFYEGAPVFAAEVRSEGDYGPVAERALAEKRADYFAAGTLVVWDVDVLGADTVRVYRSTDPGNPTVYRRGGEAEAEPAVPGWRMAVDDLFEEE